MSHSCNSQRPAACRQGAAQQFIERHRAALNAYLQHRPKLLEGAFSFLLATPRLVDFANKAAYFRAKVLELKEQHRAAPCSIAVHRAQAFEESFRQLKSKSPAELRGSLQVRARCPLVYKCGGIFVSDIRKIVPKILELFYQHQILKL